MRVVRTNSAEAREIMDFLRSKFPEIPKNLTSFSLAMDVMEAVRITVTFMPEVADEPTESETEHVRRQFYVKHAKPQ